MPLDIAIKSYFTTRHYQEALDGAPAGSPKSRRGFLGTGQGYLMDGQMIFHFADSLADPVMADPLAFFPSLDACIATAGRVVETNLWAIEDCLKSGDVRFAEYHADVVTRWSQLALIASLILVGQGNG